MPDAQPRAPIIEHLIVLDTTGTARSVPVRAHWTAYGSIYIQGDLSGEVPLLFVYGRRYEPHDGEDLPEVVAAPLTDAEHDALYEEPWTQSTRDALLDRIYEVFQPCRVAYPGPSGGMIYETRGRDA